VICMALRRFGVDTIPTIDRLGEYWQKIVFLGADDIGNSVQVNAFYTTLYPIFYDFRYIGVILIPGIFLYFLMLHVKAYNRYRNITSLFVIIFITVFFITSIFDSKITAPDFTVIMYFVVFLKPLEQFSPLARQRSQTFLRPDNGSFD